MSDLSTVEDPRVTAAQICGATHIGGSGIEWICVKEPHQKVTQRRNAAYPEPRNDPTSLAHYYVNRYPHRPPADPLA